MSEATERATPKEKWKSLGGGLWELVANPRPGFVVGETWMAMDAALAAAARAEELAPGRTPRGILPASLMDGPAMDALAAAAQAAAQAPGRTPCSIMPASLMDGPALALSALAASAWRVSDECLADNHDACNGYADNLAHQECKCAVPGCLCPSLPTLGETA